MEKQLPRIDWFKAGDQNTGVFHAKAKQCSHVNKILHLKHGDGSLCTTPEEIEEMTTNFYKCLFTEGTYGPEWSYKVCAQEGNYCNE
jgi:hypothetical protein